MIEPKEEGFQIEIDKMNLANRELLYELIREMIGPIEETINRKISQIIHNRINSILPDLLTQFQKAIQNFERTFNKNAIPRIEVLLKCGLQFPFIHKAFRVLSDTLPEMKLTPEEELLFVLRAYGKAITGQNMQIERVLQNEDYSFDVFLDKESSKAIIMGSSKKALAITEFNEWLSDNGFVIEIRLNPEYAESQEEPIDENNR